MSKLIVILLAILIFSCRNHIHTYKLDQDSKDIYNLALENTIDGSLLPPPIQPPETYQDKADSLEKVEKLNVVTKQNSLKNVVTDIPFYVIINHTIDTISNSEVGQIKRTMTSNENFQYKMNGDTSFNETINILCDNKSTTDSIDVLNFVNQPNYKIYSDNEHVHKNLTKLGSVSFSKIAFATKRNKAAVYINFICGSLCGTGQILFYMKKNGKWYYIKTWNMWVS